MTGGIFVSRHAGERYAERIDRSLTAEQGCEAIRAHLPALMVAADFGCGCVKLSNGAKIILEGRSVVTVIGRRDMPRHLLVSLAA